MARIATIKKEDIFNAALNMTRKSGFDSLSARSLATKMKMSTQPIFTYFGSMEEVKKQVYDYAMNMYKTYIYGGNKEINPILNVAMQYIQFARDEHEFYKLLFLSKPKEYYGGANEALKLSQALLREPISKEYNIDTKVMDRYFKDLWLVINSIAALTANEENDYPDEEIKRTVTEVGIALFKAYKEIDGFYEGTFDGKAVFQEILKK